MACAASDELVQLTRAQLEIATRSEHQATYLTRQQLADAPKACLPELEKAQSRSPSGDAWEETLADLLGGQWNPSNKNRADADIFVNGIGYSVKSRQLKPAACRPRWTDWLGFGFSLKVHSLKPKNDFPKGQNVLNANATVVGRRICNAFNQIREQYDVKHKWVMVRLQEDAEENHRFLLWREEIPALDPRDFRWTTTCLDSVSHSIRAERRDQPGTTAITWSSGGQDLFIRHVIPTDADTWVVPYSKVRNRKQTNRALLAGGRL